MPAPPATMTAPDTSILGADVVDDFEGVRFKDTADRPLASNGGASTGVAGTDGFVDSKLRDEFSFRAAVKTGDGSVTGCIDSFCGG